jgi:hypothetical protein
MGGMILVILYAVNSNLFAQNEYKKVIKLNPLPVIDEYSDNLSYLDIQSRVTFVYEKNINKKITPYFQFSFIGPAELHKYVNYSSANNYHVSGSGLAIGFKFYQLPGIKGIYVAPQLNYNFYGRSMADDTNVRTKIIQIIPSIIVGKQLIYSSGFTLDIFTGFGFSYKRLKDIEVDSKDVLAKYHGIGIKPFLGLMIGWGSK